MRASNRKSQIRRKKKMNGFITVIVVLFLLAGSGYLYLNHLFNQMDRVELDESDLGIEDTYFNTQNKNVINIALFGIDSWGDNYRQTRSDSIMIATLDLEHNKMKLVSVMRDTYVSIPGRGFNRIGHAYAYGGPALAVKTLNTNFDMNITDYITINFTAMEKIIDSIGGVEIKVTNSEAEWLPGISQGGTYNLNGAQALEYSRIRYVGTDYARTERQRLVMEKIAAKVLKDRSITRVMAFADSLLPYVQTSLTRGEIFNLATKLIGSGATSIVDTRIPADGHVRNATIGGRSYVLPVTLEENVEYLHRFIYENNLYKPSKNILAISKQMPR